MSFLLTLFGAKANAPALSARRDGDDLVIERGRDDSLERASPARDVRIAKGVYDAMPGRDARRALLRRAKTLASRQVVVHVPIVDARTHVGRVLVDGPRRVLRRFGLPVAEPGARFPEANGVRRLFFDEEALIEELDAVGLVVVGREGFTFVLARGDRAWTDDDDFGAELRRVVPLVALAERLRRASPRDAIAAMRARGAAAKRRSLVGRARLRRAIGWVDAFVPGGESCYRRVLLELALDAGAAREPVVFGLDVGRTGHVAFKDREDLPFDVAFEVGPD